MIRIVRYRRTWPVMFEAEAALLRTAFGARAVRIDHVGSTAVPGLAAKPVIDIQVSLATLDAREADRRLLASLGYEHVDLGEFDRIYPFFQKPGTWPSTHHVHLCEAGGPQERLHLAFRDWLRRHRGAAADYAALKRRLAAMHEGGSLASRESYSLAKTEFVTAVLRQALGSGYAPGGG